MSLMGVSRVLGVNDRGKHYRDNVHKTVVIHPLTLVIPARMVVSLSGNYAFVHKPPSKPQFWEAWYLGGDGPGMPADATVT